MLGETHAITFLGQHLILLKDRALFWEDQGILILADLHLGKAGHFRKNGIPVPRQIHMTDLDRLDHLVNTYKPEEVLFLGDLFHSDHNDEWGDFMEWSGSRSGIRQTLVLGNHDLRTADLYHQTSINVLASYDLAPFYFTHETELGSGYNIAGHVHPAVRFSGGARQTMVLPCFYFGTQNALMPAFGEFTGNHPIRPQRGDLVFAIAEDVLVGVQS